MSELLSSFLTASPFIPHGHCYLWKPGLVWLHIATDSLIALAYYSIPLILVYFVQKRRDLPFKGLFILFSTFIVSCGTTHIMEVWTLWHPTYWLSGFLKAFTAMVSICTATVMVPLIPKALALPSPAQLEAEIVDRRIAEKALKKAAYDLEKSYNLLRAVIESTPDAIFVKDLQGRHLTINYAGACVIGKTAEEIIGKDDAELFPQEVAHQLMANDRSVIAKGDREIFEEVIPTNQIKRTFLSTKTVYRDAEENIIGVIAIARDITLEKQAEKSLRKAKKKLEIRVQERTYELRQANEELQREITERISAEEALKATNQTLQTLIEASPLAIVTINTDGNVTMWNPAAERLFGWSETEVLGKPLPIVPDDQQPAFNAMLQSISQGTKLTGVDLRRQRKDGSSIDISLWTAPLFDNIGVVTGSLGLFVDISDKVRAEQALRESQQLLQAIIDNSPAIIYLKDTQGRYMMVNRKFSNLFNIDREEVKGKSEWDIFPKELADTFWKNDRQIIGSGNNIEIEETVPQSDGLHTYIAVKFPLKDSAGNPYAICGISTDITDRKRAEEALRRSEAQYRRLVETASEGIWMLDAQGNTCFANAKIAEMLGYTIEEMLGMPLNDFLDAEWQAIAATHLEQRRQGISEQHDFKFRRKDNSELWTLLSSTPIFDDAGQYVGALGMLTDISDRKRAEAALLQSEQRYRSLVVATSQIVWLNNAEGLAVDMPEWGAYTGQSKEEIADWGWLNAIHPDDREITAKVWTHAVQTKSLYETEYRIRGKDGNYRYFSVRGVPVLAEDGSIREWVGICTDIHDRKLAEEEQQKSIAVIESCSDFIGIASLDGEAFFLNEAGQKLVGLEGREQVKQTSISEYFMPQDIPFVTEQILPIVREQGGWEGEFRFRHFKTGLPIPIYHSIFTIKDRQTGQPIALATITRDITERKRAEEELRQSEAKYRELAIREALLNCLANQIRASLELDTILESAVREIRELLQVERCLFISYKLDPILPAWEVVQEAKNSELPSLMGNCTPASAIAPLTAKAMQKQIMRVEDTRKINDPVEKQFFLAVGYRSVLLMPIHTQSGGIAVISCSHSSKPRLWSDGEVDLLQAVAAQIAIAIDQAALYKQSRTAAEIAQTKAEQLEQALRELQQTQAQLIQSEKMSSLGQLVAGVAHEINNPVNFIHGNVIHADTYIQDLLKLVQVYQEYYPQPVPEIQTVIEEIELSFIKEDLLKILSSMKMGTERIRNIVLSLRNFSRLDEADMKKVDIHEGIDSSLLILQNRLKAKPDRPAIQVIKEYGNLPLIECYAGQLNQVFLNILTNAIDALEEVMSNRSLVMSNHESSANYQLPITNYQLPKIWIRTQIIDKTNVMICIADNGPGMTQEVQSKLFDPFFTTKSVGAGTGLGMSISYKIIEKHRGQLTCSSTLGEGAQFFIKIPIRQSLGNGNW